MRISIYISCQKITTAVTVRDKAHRDKWDRGHYPEGANMGMRQEIKT